MPFVKKNIKIENINEFEPIELNELNVNKIYDRCLASEEEIKEKRDLILTQCLMKKYAGIESDLSVFSKSKLEANKKSIQYLLGQLNISNEFDFLTSKKNSNEQYWTTDLTMMCKIFDLSKPICDYAPFRTLSSSHYRASIIGNIKPTLSPNDPNFPAWWAEHKSEWEEPKKEENVPDKD